MNLEMLGIIIESEPHVTSLPTSFFTAGMLLLQHSQLTAMDFFEEVDNSYGVDNEGPEPVDEEGSVAVPQLNFQLRPTDLQQLHNTINPLSPSGNHGIDLYEQTVEFINHL